jgi:imidazolonepropionase-like amidohydrolase
MRALPLLFVLAFGCAHGPTVAFVGGTVIASPTDPPLTDGVVVAEGGRITAVGTRVATAVPAGARIINCGGAIVLAGFWNAHVHFSEPAWQAAGTAPAAGLEEALDEMLLRWGFVHVVDAGSLPSVTFPLRRRIQNGELRGPAIISAAGTTFVARGGQPRYVPFPLPQLATAEQARAEVRAAIERGADAIKIMTASVVAHPPPPVMPVEVVRAVTDEAHRRGVKVLAHPTTAAGVWAAVDGGVDVLAHTAPQAGRWSAADIARMRATDISLVPTLKLWQFELHDEPAVLARFEAAAVDQVRSFAGAGGRLLFGTDVGYVTDHDPGEEYTLLARAGLSFSQILAMLTTAPAALFEGGPHGHVEAEGRLRAGERADLVVLDGDPRRDPAAWTAVRYAVRNGVIVHPLQ